MSNAKSIPITPRRKKNFKDDPGADDFVSGGMSRPSDTRPGETDRADTAPHARSTSAGAGEEAPSYPRAVAEAPEAAPDTAAPQHSAQIPPVGPKGKKTTDPLGNPWPWFTESVSKDREKIVNFRFPETLDAQLTVAAKRVGMSKKELAAKAVEDYVRRIFDSEGIAYDRDDM
ncbi:hypothetical protein CKO28_08925 [Rhodovibrio sodomensis]|uniref:CopG family transcriptional regulator n=1 Tax=Rhodovibrio sodomensis TaxID=1088 RepID=A0ABS1DCG2_9PROT|nr:hypothetical protein [Rhodovibrio sodomensis]MBK1668158.1 hypothetical protein [Rhodovibrio sodomensis]